MKRIVKKNYKMIIGIIVGLMISSIGVYAIGSLSSSEISYDNGDSKLQSTDMQGAIDELYEKAKTPKYDIPQANNTNIVKAYYYNQESSNPNYCVTGYEKTCKISSCYMNEVSNSCQPGTIVDYKVNDNSIIRFHVVHDDGDTMTLQSQKNTLNDVKWYSDKTTAQGPITALTELESTTEGWANVNILDYSIGNSESTLGYSGCSEYNSCLNTVYTLIRDSVKARMITLQEAFKVGCISNSESCPIWMYNFLSYSRSYAGTENDSTSHKYWLMSTSISNGVSVWHVDASANVGLSQVLTSSAIRAVVVINK